MIRPRITPSNASPKTGTPGNGGWSLLISLALIASLSACSDQTPPRSSPSSPSPAIATNAAPPTGSTRSGPEIFDACLLCHSTREMQRGPIIDGLPAWYVTAQLEKFRAGIRGGNEANRSEHLMAAGLSSLLSPREIPVVADYISRLPPQPHLLTVRGDKMRGRQIFQMCVPCHGDHGQGQELIKAPPIRLLEDWYLLDQLRKFKARLRGGHPLNYESKTMQGIAGPLSESDFRDVVRYIAEDLAPSHVKK